MRRGREGADPKGLLETHTLRIGQFHGMEICRYTEAVRGTWALPWLVSACGFSPAQADGGSIVHDGLDAKVFLDARPDAPSNENCFGSLDYDKVCYLKSGPQPTGTVNINALDMRNTEAGICDANAIVAASNPCVIAADKIIIAGTGDLRVTGMRALILLATGTGGININSGGTIDVGSTTADLGAGGVASCAGSTAASAHGGGYGGSFVALGGNGGNDANGNGRGIHATALAPPDALQGGCPGGVGAPDTNAVPGNGGGGIALIGATIVVDGIVVADGGGGKGATVDAAGGGGGGAGGMIVLDSTAISGVGEVNVSGGGGGGGVGGLPPGGDGKDGYIKLDRTHEGDGGTDNTSGGDGGNGGPRSGSDSGENGHDGSSGSSGGGGGGGAKGVIVTTSTPGGTITGLN
jgi:hypothetical protein